MVVRSDGAFTKWRIQVKLWNENYVLKFDATAAQMEYFRRFRWYQVEVVQVTPPVFVHYCFLWTRLQLVKPTTVEGGHPMDTSLVVVMVWRRKLHRWCHYNL